MVNQIMKVLVKKNEKVQYNDALAITVAIKESSQNKLCSELGFATLKFRHWFMKLCTFYKIKEIGVSKYLFDLIPQISYLYNTYSLEDVTTFYCSMDVFKYSFYPYTIAKWRKLDRKIR